MVNVDGAGRSEMFVVDSLCQVSLFLHERVDDVARMLADHRADNFPWDYTQPGAFDQAKLHL